MGSQFSVNKRLDFTRHDLSDWVSVEFSVSATKSVRHGFVVMGLQVMVKSRSHMGVLGSRSQSRSKQGSDLSMNPSAKTPEGEDNAAEVNKDKGETLSAALNIG